MFNVFAVLMLAQSYENRVFSNLTPENKNLHNFCLNIIKGLSNHLTQTLFFLGETEINLGKALTNQVKPWKSFLNVGTSTEYSFFVINIVAQMLLVSKSEYFANFWNLIAVNQDKNILISTDVCSGQCKLFYCKWDPLRFAIQFQKNWLVPGFELMLLDSVRSRMMLSTLRPCCPPWNFFSHQLITFFPSS